MGNLTTNFSLREFLTDNSDVPDLIQVLKLQDIRTKLNSGITINWFKNMAKGDKNNVYEENISITNVSYRENDIVRTEDLIITLDEDDMIPIHGLDFKHDPDLLNLTYYNAGSLGLKSAMIAMVQLGFKEGDKNKNPFGEMFDLDHLPWCMLFTQWAWKKSDFKEEFYTKYYAHVKSVWDAIPHKRLSINKTGTGDGIFWYYGEGQGHAGLVLYNDLTEKKIYTIEGNSGNMVKLKKYSYEELLDSSKKAKLLGFASPSQQSPTNINIMKPDAKAVGDEDFDLNR